MNYTSPATKKKTAKARQPRFIIKLADGRIIGRYRVADSTEAWDAFLSDHGSIDRCAAIFKTTPQDISDADIVKEAK